MVDNSFLISVQKGLHVIVMNISGFQKLFTKNMASK